MLSIHPILFLDVDGVLNSAEWMNKGHMRTMNPINHFDPDACKRLNTVVKATGAAVVLSSSWRILHPFKEVESLINRRGGDAVVIIGSTTTGRMVLNKEGVLVPSKCRGDEILDWLVKNDRLGVDLR